jgi:transcription antitermination factor NusG
MVHSVLCDTVKESEAMVSAPLPAPNAPHWYALYTMPRHEKRVALQLGRHSIDYFLPLYETVHRWKNKRARLELPLFPSYLFVRIPREGRVEVLQLPGVHYLVNIDGKPIAISDREIQVLQIIVSSRLRVAAQPYLAIGRRVRVKAGPLQGSEGILVRHKNNFRVVLSMDLIMRSVAVDVDLADVETFAT